MTSNPTIARRSASASRRAPKETQYQYLLTADETSLAELEAMIQTLPICARGRVFVEVESPEDVSVLDVPTRMTVTWLTRSNRSGAPGSCRSCAPGEAVARAVTAWSNEMLCDLPDEQHVKVWLGGHYRGVAAAHEHLTSNLGIRDEKITTPEAFRLHA